MDIIKASNTPTLINQIIGNGTFLVNIPSTLEDQTIVINKSSIIYDNNSIINISNIEVSYTDLGLLNAPIISANTKNPQVTFENFSKFVKPNSDESIIDNEPYLKSLYDEIILYKNKSSDSKDIISRETYMLLSIQSIVNLLNSICNFILLNDEIKNQKNSDSFYTIIFDICNSLYYASNGIKLLSTLIGQEFFSSNYADRIKTELLDSFSALNSAYNSTQNYNNIENKNTYLTAIKSFLTTNINFKFSDKNSVELFTSFRNFILQVFENNNLLIKLLSNLSSYSSDVKYTTIINCLKKITEISTYTVNTVYVVYKNISDNYENIINQIQNYINDVASLSLKPNTLKLLKIFDTNFSVRNYFFKNISKNLKSNNIEKPNYKKNISNSEVISNFDITFEFYIYNFNIYISGTIGAKEFTGYLSYPGLYNLNYFGIDNINITTEITLPSNVSNFNMKQCLNPELEITTIVPNSIYHNDNSYNFSASINLAFSVNGEVISSALLPIVIAK